MQRPLFPSPNASFFPDPLALPPFVDNPAVNSFRSPAGPASSAPMASMGPMGPMGPMASMGPVGSVGPVGAFNYPLGQPLLRKYQAKPAPPGTQYTYISGQPSKGQVTIGIPGSLCGGVLGRKGNNLRFINQSTLCTISLQRREDVPEGKFYREAVITGSPKGIERAV